MATITCKPNGYATDIITDMARDWLKKCDADRPFLPMYQHKAPHREWEPDPTHFDLTKDPGERKSVYGDAAYAGVIKELKDELARLRKLYRADEFKEPALPKNRKAG